MKYYKPHELRNLGQLLKKSFKEGGRNVSIDGLIHWLIAGEDGDYVLIMLLI
jgi:hypothetical protein